MKGKTETTPSRRDFLKKSLRKAGYIVPLVSVISLSSLDTWAKSYGRESGRGTGRGKGRDKGKGRRRGD